MFKSLSPKDHLLAMSALVSTGWSAHALLDTISKTLAQDYDVHQIIMTTSFVGMAFLGGWIFLAKGWRGFASKRLKWHLARGFLIGFVAIAVVNALALIPLAEFYGIVFISPFLVLIMTVLFLKEHVGWHRWMAVAAGFTGVIVLAGPQFMHFGAGVILAFLAAFLVAASTILVRKIGPGEFLPLYGFYPFFFMFLVNTPLALPNLKLPEISDIWLFAAGGPLVVLGQLAVTYAIAHVKETAIIAPFHYIQIIWGVVLGYLIFGDIPALTTLSGIFLIASAGLYTIYREYHLAHAED